MIFIDCDGAEKSTLSHTASRVRNNTCKMKRKDLTESIGVIPAKYPPKVKLKLLTILKCKSWGELCVPQLVRILGLLQQQKVNIFFLIQKSFSYRSPYERILRNPFLVGVFISIGHEIFPYICMSGGQVQVTSGPSIPCIPLSLMSSAFHLQPRLTPSVWSHKLHTVAMCQCQWIQGRQVCLECCSTPLYQRVYLQYYPYQIGTKI